MKSKHVTKNWKKVQDYDLMSNVCEQTKHSYKFIFFKIACISHTTTRPSKPNHQPINQCLPDVEITLHIVESCSFTWIHVIMFVCGPLVEAALDMRLPAVANPLKFALLWSIYTSLPPFMTYTHALLERGWHTGGGFFGRVCNAFIFPMHNRGSSNIPSRSLLHKKMEVVVESSSGHHVIGDEQQSGERQGRTVEGLLTNRGRAILVCS